MRMIGGSTRLSTLVIDANKSWEEKALTHVQLTPSLIYDSNFNNAPILNMCMPYNNEILLNSVTETFLVGVAPTILKIFKIACSGRYRVKFDVKVESALYTGTVILQMSGVPKQNWPFLANTTYQMYQSNVYTSYANEEFQILVYGNDPLSKIYIGTTQLLGAAFNQSPMITLE